MKALSLHQPYASLIASGVKSIETRTWRTQHRGDLLICASRKDGLPRGVVLCIVNVIDCRPMIDDDAAAACTERYPAAWAWILADVRKVPLIPIRGGRRIFHVDWEALLARHANE